MHPELDRLRAFTTGELPGGARAELAEHLAACADCRHETALVRDLRLAAAEVTMVAPRPGLWAEIEARREAGEARVLPAADGSAPGGRATRHWARAAAVVLLCIGGVASATLFPGWPLREWWAESREPAPAAEPGGAPGSAEPAAPAPTDAPVASASMAVAPVGEAVRVSVLSPAAATRIRVRLSDGPDAQVEARGEAAEALLRTGAGSIEVVEPGPGEVRVALPRALRRATLVVDGVPYLVKEGDEIRVLAPYVDTVGAELVFGTGR